ncbi:hypothetical protein FGG08_006351 [Glutinoglossum americanum]|uniref:Protein transport protein sec73 n=1 Tax=Glutinoglossum americanum TaxID=1670608 RepID=A0A9P8I7K6_9PEZI|nr:hypothetical protein FGG08_006351 [Glutinoglossum americanum]
MPLPALLRRHRRSETDLRRHSTADPAQYTRHSEHVPRTRPSTDFLSPYHATYPSATSSQSSNQRDLPSDESTRPSYESGFRPVSPQTNEQPHKHRRFSLLRNRNASDSQLGARAKAQAAQGRERQKPPAIITTAPTMDTLERPLKQKQRLRLPGGLKSRSHTNLPCRSSQNSAESFGKGSISGNGSLRASRVTFDESDRAPSLAPQNDPTNPPSYDESHASLPIPNPRVSDSSRSDGSSGEHVAYATTTTTHTVSTTTTFFRLPRRKKARPSLFPLPARTGLPESGSGSPATPTASSNVSREFAKISGSTSPAMAANSPGPKNRADPVIPSPLSSPTHVALATSSMNFAAPGTAMLRQDSTASTKSTGSSPSSLVPPTRLGRRGRSSTIGSAKDVIDDVALPTPPLPSSRTSTSTIGRSSFGGLFNITHRLRQNSEPSFPRYISPGPGTPVSNNSKSNSLHLIREPVAIPVRADDDTPAKYLARLEEAVSRGVVASVLSKAGDTFAQAVLKSYMRSFMFFGDPMDMAIRKLLMEVELPKETQQIDRVVQAFADRYHECNPGIYASPDQAYFIAFSLLILHTDVFNKNNKRKMQRQDYIKNTSGEGISDDILECFYDNISYTPFIHVEDDVDINGEKIVPHKSRMNLFTRGSSDSVKRPSREPVDPYTLIIDSKLEVLRPTLKDVMNLDDPYSYLGTADSLDLPNLHKTFFRSAVLQIVSARSRPEAFMSPTTISNPEEAHPGVVDIKVTKVGLLWRKEAKRKKARSPWQEWGAILTGSQLYFFRNTTWIKNLMHQYDAHHKHGHAGAPVTFKPPLENFKPDALMSTDDAVALLDSSYKKHKHAFVFVRHGGFEETFLADTENEMNDWLAMLNYAAAFRTAGVRMRGLVGGNYEGQRTRGIRRLGTGNSAQSVQTPTGEVSILSGKIDAQLAQQILAARRQIMSQKISEAEEKLLSAQKQLDGQLRNARHLQILAPIQAKTREQVILAAGRMAAKLKWVRVEIWRLRCHKDILLMDLEDERKSTIDKQLRQQAISAPGPLPLSTPESQRDGLDRFDSKTSRSGSPQRSPRTPTESRPTKSPSLKGLDFGMDDIFHAPSHLSRQSSYKRNPPSWELPPLAFDSTPVHRGSTSSTNPISPTPSNLTKPQSRSSGIGSDGQTGFSDATGRETPAIYADDSENDVTGGAALFMTDSPSPSPKIIEAPNEDDNQRGKPKKGSEAEAPEKSKVRRSLQRTLRDTHAPSHHRSRRGKDSGSGVIGAEDGGTSPEKEGLARGTGSFTVHGKKASVITFGSEWQNVSPEEKLRLRKQSHNDETRLSAHSIVDNDGESSAFPSLTGWRRGSTASQSTATVRSFQRWESREVSVDADTESLAALSVSDGRRTPLTTIQDQREEEGRLSSSHSKENDRESSEEQKGESVRSTDGVPRHQLLPQAVST